METEKEQPIWKCKYGRVSCAIFSKEITKNSVTFTVYNCVISRNYKDADGLWHKTDSFSLHDLHDLKFCATKAYDEVRSRQ